VLTGFATRLRGLCRESDVVARLGGDEFAFLLVDPVTPQQAAAIAERVVLTASAPFLIGEDVISVGASVGITLLTEGEPGLERQVDTVEVLLRQADAAMYRAKNSGRGRAEQYRPGLAGPPSALPTGEAQQLRRALDDGLLELHYQPIYNLANGELVKLEALARWRDAHRGYIPPTEFIAVAEACGLIHDLGRWALRTACRQAVHWGRQSGADERPPKVAVSVSAHQLAGGSLVDVRRRCRATRAAHRAPRHGLRQGPGLPARHPRGTEHGSPRPVRAARWSRQVRRGRAHAAGCPRADQPR